MGQPNSIKLPIRDFVNPTLSEQEVYTHQLAISMGNTMGSAIKFAATSDQAPFKFEKLRVISYPLVFEN